MPTEKRCAHPGCPCPADPGSDYCSVQCQAAMSSSLVDCPCNHGVCRQSQRTNHQVDPGSGVSGSYDPLMHQQDKEKPLLDDWGKSDKH